eukprot:scaffold42096_cov20-Tisochrysis_lutea.AAC.1
MNTPPQGRTLMQHWEVPVAQLVPDLQVQIGTPTQLCPQEMNTPTPGRTLTQHRKVAVNFRDTALIK